MSKTNKKSKSHNSIKALAAYSLLISKHQKIKKETADTFVEEAENAIKMISAGGASAEHLNEIKYFSSIGLILVEQIVKPGNTKESQEDYYWMRQNMADSVLAYRTLIESLGVNSNAKATDEMLDAFKVAFNIYKSIIGKITVAQLEKATDTWESYKTRKVA